MSEPTHNFDAKQLVGHIATCLDGVKHLTPETQIIILKGAVAIMEAIVDGRSRALMMANVLTRRP